VLARLALGRDPLGPLWSGLAWRGTARRAAPRLASAPG
jgi:hypothetical protein